ncbi:MAG: hypothetical protein JXR83_10700 [Deltaproteobacteria bacterium]|nr:hypothetical protein [Deltaproteobacteria bacterium]
MTMSLRAVAGGLALTVAVGCAAADPDATVTISLQLPERVVCAAPPSDIRAQLFVSGMAHRSCDLVVNTADNSVSGDCPNITARLDRVATLDYFIMDTTAHGGDGSWGVDKPYRLLLAQATKTLALSKPASDVIEVTFTDSDFVAMDQCRDMPNTSEDTGVGPLTVDDFVTGASPCDVDDDAVSNVEEKCTQPTPTDAYDPSDP